MKRIKPLSEVERDTLEAGFRYGPTPRFRQRCHALLLHEQGYLLRELGGILGVHPTTISEWLNRWEQHGIAGLHDSPRSGRPVCRRTGRPSIYQGPDLGLLQQFLEEDPRRLAQAKDRLEQATGKRSCMKTLQRALKKGGVCMEALPAQPGHPARRNRLSPGPGQPG